MFTSPFDRMPLLVDNIPKTIHQFGVRVDLFQETPNAGRLIGNESHAFPASRGQCVLERLDFA